MTHTILDVTHTVLGAALGVSTLRRWENKITPFQYARITLFCTVPILLIHLTEQRWLSGAAWTAIALISARSYLKTRPLPVWWDGQHERIDNTQEN